MISLCSFRLGGPANFEQMRRKEKTYSKYYMNVRVYNLMYTYMYVLINTTLRKKEIFRDLYIS